MSDASKLHSILTRICSCFISGLPLTISSVNYTVIMTLLFHKSCPLLFTSFTSSTLNTTHNTRLSAWFLQLGFVGTVEILSLRLWLLRNSNCAPDRMIELGPCRHALYGAGEWADFSYSGLCLMLRYKFLDSNLHYKFDIYGYPTLSYFALSCHFFLCITMHITLFCLIIIIYVILLVPVWLWRMDLRWNIGGWQSMEGSGDGGVHICQRDSGGLSGRINQTAEHG